MLTYCLDLGLGKFLGQKGISGSEDTYTRFSSKFLPAGETSGCVCGSRDSDTGGTQLFSKRWLSKTGFFGDFGSHLKLSGYFLTTQWKIFYKLQLSISFGCFLEVAIKSLAEAVFEGKFQMKLK